MLTQRGQGDQQLGDAEHGTHHTVGQGDAANPAVLLDNLHHPAQPHSPLSSPYLLSTIKPN
jgi:hypothetical protein